MDCDKNSVKTAILFVFCLIFLTSGCASMGQKKKLSAFNKFYSSGNYTAAADIEIKAKGDKKNDTSKLLPSLQAASALRSAHKYSESSLFFDECENIIKHHNEKLMAENAALNAGAILINDTVMDYSGTEYDGIMVNTYKALNFWQIGKKELARVEFNRALDRQRRAKNRFAAEIAKQKKKLEKIEKEKNQQNQAKNKNNQKMDFDKTANNPEIDKILKEKYSNLYEFKKYPDFINPFTTYMAGIFFMSEKDYTKAAPLLKEAYGMVEENETVLKDFLDVEKRLDGVQNNSYHTWVVFENGLGPVKKEFRVDLPILLFTDKVKYTGIALPKLELRERPYPCLTIKHNDERIGQTSTLASMDRVVQTEFKKEYKSIVTRAVISTLIKTYGQYMAQKELGDLGGFAAAIYQGVTTSADIRIWTALPKEFQVAKFETPETGNITIETQTGVKMNIEVPCDKNALVYVKIPTSMAKPVYDIIEM